VGIKELKEKVFTWAKTAGKTMSIKELKDKALKWGDAAKESISQTIDSAKDKIGEQAGSLIESVGNVKDNISKKISSAESDHSDENMPARVPETVAPVPPPQSSSEVTETPLSMEELMESFEAAKTLYNEIKEEFETKDEPDEAEPEEIEGELNISAVESEEECEDQTASETESGEITESVTLNQWFRNTADELYKSAAELGDNITSAAKSGAEIVSLGSEIVYSGVKKAARVASGYQGYEDRGSAKKIKEASEAFYIAAKEITEAKRTALNEKILSFGRFRLESLHETLGRFLGFLNDMGQKNRDKEYEILDGIGIDSKTIEEMKDIDMSASKALTSTAITGALGAAAAFGTPALVTGVVGALAAASTGTAITTLSGAAATNAILAWLGGGAIAAGGGGVAAGAATLAVITAGATGGVALLAAGLMISTHYSRKLTEAKEYQKEVELSVAEMEKAWSIMDGIFKRADEMLSVTKELYDRVKENLDYLEPLSLDFDTSIEYYNKAFQENGLLIKSISELSKVPLLNENGEVSEETASIIMKTHSILNKELVHNE
jgi:hypothetical protein